MLLAALAVSMSATVKAQTYLGHGGVNCGDFSVFAADKGPAVDATWDWMLGYVSGLNTVWKNNVAGTDPLIRASADEVLTHTIGYCKANPGRNVLNAINDYWYSLPK